MRRFLGLYCLLLICLTGCDFFPSDTGGGGGGGGGGNTGDYLYVGNSGNTYIAGFSVSTTGALSVLSGSPYNNGIAMTGMAVTPANTFLYVATANGIYGNVINSNGSISILNSGAPLAQDMIPTTMQVDATGNYLLAAGISVTSQVQAVGIYTINTTTGILSAITGSPLNLYTGTGSTATVVTPTAMWITPNNAYVYVSLGTLGVQICTLGANGALSTGASPAYLLPASTSISASDQGLSSDPSSLFLFVAEINTGLRVFSIGAGGSLKEISGSPYSVGTGPTAVALDKTGSYVYVANKGSNSISAFTLTAASGTLTEVTGSPISSGGQLPAGILADRSKDYIAVINSGDNSAAGNADLQLFKFDATTDGLLAPVSSATTGTDPTYPGYVVATF
jgi:6-phosphogluconolactonase